MNPNKYKYHRIKPFSNRWYKYMIIRCLEEYEVSMNLNDYKNAIKYRSILIYLITRK